MPAALAASCGTHADKAAVATCRRCGLFLCDNCVALIGEDSFCAACAERKNLPPSWRSRLALGLGLFSLFQALVAPIAGSVVFIFSGPLLAALAFALSLSERRRIQRREASERTRPWANAALLSSAFSVLLWLAWVALALISARAAERFG